MYSPQINQIYIAVLDYFSPFVQEEEESDQQQTDQDDGDDDANYDDCDDKNGKKNWVRFSW